MKIYVASRYQRREEMKDIRDVLVFILGHEVTSRWLDYEDQKPEAFDLVESEFSDSSAHVADAERVFVCDMDFEDVLEADCIVLFTPTGSRGGCNVEWGMAMAAGKRCILVGPRGNIFHHWSKAEWFENSEEFLLSIGAANQYAAD
jgi:hypothetical protein